MAMIDWIDRRLHNWARWIEGGMSGGLGYASGSIWDRVKVDQSPRRDAVIPTNACEASETHEEVEKLEHVLQDTLRIYYFKTSCRAEIARTLGISTATVDSRLTKAHRVLADVFAERSRVLAEQRERMVSQVAKADEERRRMGAVVRVVLRDMKTRG